MVLSLSFVQDEHAYRTPENSSKSKSPNIALNMVSALSEKVENDGRYTSEMSNVAGS